ncbi:DUF4430 domain-containing protein [Bacillus sp. B-jedd]|uniref:DUF4430 domain-containing protein n=1 Tax=Bacillus sp. B-jedd TaxID=1476857 RepID=UPI0005157177|nr:DUF4430 domain-containing protein [Bacillus sp. B-jedd]CEG28349.1 lipoprotein [Bacillus sp. B-jedd]
MRRKIIFRLVLVFSLLAAFALTGCGTAPETKQNPAKEAKPDIALNDKNGADKNTDGGESDAGKGEEAPALDTPVTNEASEDVTANKEKASTSGDNSSVAPDKEAASKNSSANQSAPSSGSGTLNSPSSGGTGKTGGTAGSSAPTTSSGTGTADTKNTSQPAPKPAPKPAAKPAPAATATISIKGPTAVGSILSATAIEVKEGDTVFDLLHRGTSQKGIYVAKTGSASTLYVEGMESEKDFQGNPFSLYEFDYGANSGWTCKKNGVTIDRSAGIVKVAKGDRIEWIYIED